MRQQQVDQQKETLTTKVLHCIVNKMDQFDGRNISKCIPFYPREVELNRISKYEMVKSFELSVVSKICGKMRELKKSDNEY